MKHSTQHQLPSKLKMLLVLICILTGSNSFGQSMYGDTIFWENFGTGTGIADISGRGSVGGTYKYAGASTFVYALSTSKLTSYVSNPANASKNFIIDAPRFHEVPITSTAVPQADKPAAGSSTLLTKYWPITTWSTMTLGTAVNITSNTDDFEATTATVPASWLKVDGVWRFGYYYVTYQNTSYTPDIPEDGYYALVNDLDNFGRDYLKWDWFDHSGVTAADLGTTPYDPYTIYTPLATKTPTTVTPKAREATNGRMLFVNCSKNSALAGAVYKRQVTELCRGAEFEFSLWAASVHYNDNNSNFRIEIWSADPGNDPNIGTLTTSYIGQQVAIANNATLIHMGPKVSLAELGKWYQITEHFTLTSQDYCWVVVRNFGSGSGNDIVIDDLVFKPYAPFNLVVALTTESKDFACTDGLVSLISTFTAIPAYIDIAEYGFYFQGERNGTWTRLGNSIPIQTQSSSIPLELTIPVAEYNLYSRFRVIVATTPAGFGGRCITFTYPPVDKEPLPTAPNFTISGNDVCDDLGSTTETGSYRILFNNQVNCQGWRVKYRINGGAIQTGTPATKATCQLQAADATLVSQTVLNGGAISNIVYTFAAPATSAVVTNLPAGLSASAAGSSPVTISGTPTESGTYTITAYDVSNAVVGTISGYIKRTELIGPITSIRTQTSTGGAITNIVYQWATDIDDTTVQYANVPAGLTVNKDDAANTITISGIPTASGTYSVYTLNESYSGTITRQ